MNPDMLTLTGQLRLEAAMLLGTEFSIVSWQDRPCLSHCGSIRPGIGNLDCTCQTARRDAEIADLRTLVAALRGHV